VVLRHQGEESQGSQLSHSETSHTLGTQNMLPQNQDEDTFKINKGLNSTSLSIFTVCMNKK